MAVYHNLLWAAVLFGPFLTMLWITARLAGIAVNDDAWRKE